MTPEQMAEIQRLRNRQVAPKQIARKLGLRPADVKAAIQQQAIAQQQEGPAKGELSPLEACLANGGMVNALLRGGVNELDLNGGNSGLGAVMVVRKHRSTLITSTFLVDYYCLGIKNVSSFKTTNYDKYLRMKAAAFTNFLEEAEEISLEQAQAIVFGAVDYARRLGFEPHEDFETAKEILGQRPESLPDLTFGKDGKPFYFDGPYDNPQKIIRTLEKSVGKGNFNFMLQAPLGIGGGPTSPLFPN